MSYYQYADKEVQAMCLIFWLVAATVSSNSYYHYEAGFAGKFYSYYAILVECRFKTC